MSSSLRFLSIQSTFIVFMILFGSTVSAQKGQISGQVLDSVENQPLEYASIALFQIEDSIQAAGVLADSSGNFFLANVKKGIYFLHIRFLGYEPYVQSSINLEAGEKLNLGAIGMKLVSKLLDEIEINGRKSRSFHKMDRQVYDAQQFQNAQGGSATDVLRNLPGVSIDAQGEISLRGSQGFTVMMDGRQIQTDAATLLNSLPANAIQNIEILTTPSAKYDPDGKAGIINITTRKGAANGMYLQVNALLGAPNIESYDNAEASHRFGGDITLNVKKGSWDLSFGLDYRRDDVGGQRIGYVNTYLNEVLTEYPSAGERSFDKYQYSGRFSALHRLKDNQQISFNFFAGDRTQYRTADILYAPQIRTQISPTEFLGAESYWDLFQQSGDIFTGGELVNTQTYYNENLRVRQGDFLIGGIDYS